MVLQGLTAQPNKDIPCIDRLVGALGCAQCEVKYEMNQTSLAGW